MALARIPFSELEDVVYGTSVMESDGETCESLELVRESELIPV